MQMPRPTSHQSMPPHAERVFHGVIFDVYQWDEPDFRGGSLRMERLIRPDTAFVLPVLDDGRILFAAQEQPGRPPFMGLLGGRVEEGEAPLLGAQRELLEESGYVADTWELFDVYQPFTKIEWCMWTYVARGCKKISEQSLDPGERIDLRAETYAEFTRLVLDESIDGGRIRTRFLEGRAFPEKQAELDRFFLPTPHA